MSSSDSSLPGSPAGGAVRSAPSRPVWSLRNRHGTAPSDRSARTRSEAVGAWFLRMSCCSRVRRVSGVGLRRGCPPVAMPASPSLRHRPAAAPSLGPAAPNSATGGGAPARRRGPRPGPGRLRPPEPEHWPAGRRGSGATARAQRDGPAVARPRRGRCRGTRRRRAGEPEEHEPVGKLEAESPVRHPLDQPRQPFGWTGLTDALPDQPPQAGLPDRMAGKSSSDPSTSSPAAHDLIMSGRCRW